MGRYGMAGDHYRQSGYVTLQDVPDPNREYVETFQNLTGGINRFDLDYRLKGNESPFLQNLSWHNGTLTSRLGQVEKWGLPAETEAPMNWPLSYVTSSPFLYHGWLLTQAKMVANDEDVSRMYAVKLRLEGTANESAVGTVQPLGAVTSYGGVPGTFVRYRELVLFKSAGAYCLYKYDNEHDVVEISEQSPYIPIIQIDSDPVSGGGQPNQKVNALIPVVKVGYNITQANTLQYKLPVKPFAAAVTAFTTNGTQTTNYEIASVDYTAGVVTLETAPPVGAQLFIQFELDDDTINSTVGIMRSPAIAVFGGAQDLCVVVGGPDTQPNAYFWSGIDGNTMNPLYFPINQWNLAGDNDEPITCFGKQQNMLVIFQPHATGRAVFGTETLDGLVQVTMNYTRINAEIGCDLPGSLQLVENNLVWCNRRYGVCRLKDSSAAYENNIVQISRKINGDYRLAGLLEQLKSVADVEVHSVDTGKRYILVLGDEDGKAYEWNYELSQYDNPSWFFHTNILGVGFVPLANEELYEVTADGKVCTFEMVFSDFGTEPINKIYRFPPRDFGSYDRLKNIKSILVTTRSDAKTNTQLKYTCDYAERIDPTNLVVILNRLLYAAVFRRKPGYHNIHHLGIELSNNVAGDDLNIVSAQIFYEYRGRTR